MMKLKLNLALVWLAIILKSQSVFAPLSTASNSSCPIWTLPQEKGAKCKCGSDVNSVIACDKTTLNISIEMFHCMTYSEIFNRTVVGYCLFNLHRGKGIYRDYSNWPLPRLEERNDTALCHYADRCQTYNHNHEYNNYRDCTHYEHQTGLMCTSCVDGYAYPVYSYSMTCVECTDYKYNWLKYIAVAFLPLTLFYIIVVLFRITVTSGALNGYILICQLITAPPFVYIYVRYDKTPTTGVYLSFFGIWNLDFFRALYPPFCMHPKLTTLQTLMFDYVIAVYPLVLVIVTYICVKLHNRYSIVVRLWSPFYKCFALLRNNWDIKGSLVGAFATFILLSYVKILNVSFVILTPNIFYDVEGNQMSKRFLYFDGSYEYFGVDHIPYALLAIFMLLVFNIFPLLLLCLYPCRCFQRCLNYCRLQSLALHIFMDTFNGCYKIKPRDCRYFAALYLFLRIANLALIGLTTGLTGNLISGMLMIIMTFVVATVRPHKSLMHTLADTVLLANLIAACFHYICWPITDDTAGSYVSFIIQTIRSVEISIPLLYGIGILFWSVFPKKLFLKLKSLCKRTVTPETPPPYRLDHSDEYPPLLP